jgi:dipeptidyl aminopeptidase/acylaminoacyl peptidase
MLAISTNHDLFLRNITDGNEIKITDNPAYDGAPQYSPDGKYIAYVSMEKPGYESDQQVLTLYNTETGEHTFLSSSIDRSAEEFLWAPDSKSLFFATRDEGSRSIYHITLDGNITKLSKEGWNSSLDISPDGSTLYFTRSYNYQPNEIYRYSIADKSSERLTYFTKDFTNTFDLPELEEIWFEGQGGTKVQGFIQKPPNFQIDKKYPLVLCIHGGPQNMWGDRFMSSWFTFQLISSEGYVGLFINPRGSSGYGDLFREQISRNYGTYTYPDLMNGVDYVLENYDYVDPDKLGAIGGSFGGYAVNWIMGKTDRFDCIVSHASLYNLVSFYGATEELWFPAWDMGETPWDEPELYEKHSPHTLASNFKTPTLVTHGQMDFRVPFAESLQLFTALQRQGVPSRLVVFPDEGHVIYGPQNNVRWWKEIHLWFEQYLK